MRILADSAFLFLAILFLVIWLVSWVAFHVAGGLIHLLLVLAIGALILHFVRRTRSV